MTTTTITFLHCDFPGCDEQTPGDAGDGWTSAIYTHGCPAHGEAIAVHEATVESWTARRKDWYSLKCACGWMPRPGVAAWAARELKEKHLAHVAEALASWEPAEQPGPCGCGVERACGCNAPEPARGGTLPASDQTTEEDDQ